MPASDSPKKSERIAAFVKTLDLGGGDAQADPRFLGYFECFDRGDYYEAHDVLEDLWLATTGPDREFYKGLIQVAGAFVHLRKQHEQPTHPHHGRRLAPAARIFRSAIARLAPFAPHHHGVHTAALLEICEGCLETIESNISAKNPWEPGKLPKIPKFID